MRFARTFLLSLTLVCVAAVGYYMRDRSAGEWQDTLDVAYGAFSASGMRTPAAEVERPILNLSEVERAYVEKSPLLKVIFAADKAPIAYYDSQGVLRGLGISFFDEISRLTGLRFDYSVVDSQQELAWRAEKRSLDLLMAAEDIYKVRLKDVRFAAHPCFSVNKVLYMRKGQTDAALNMKAYAGVRGEDHPLWVRGEVREYPASKDAVRAVVAGEADYGYDDALCVAWCKIISKYDNLKLQLYGSDVRDYGTAFFNNDPSLYSVMEKAMAVIDESRRHVMMLEAMSYVEQDITIRGIARKYMIPLLLLLGLLVASMTYTVILRKRTVQKKVVGKLQQLDSMTELFNFDAFAERAETRMQERRETEIDALMLLDIDDFTELNEKQGRNIGDLAIRLIAKLLLTVFRKDDIIGRIQGDQFAIYMHNVKNADIPKRKGDEICRIVSLGFSSGGETIPASISIGIAIVDQDMDYVNAFEIANKALQHVKETGKNNCVVFRA